MPDVSADVIHMDVAYSPSVALRGSLIMIRFNPPGTRVLAKRWEFALAITDANKQFLDLTNYTITMAIGASPSGPPIQTVTAILADQTAETGKATAVFLPADTAGFTIPLSGEFYYQVDASLDAANKDTLASGYFRAQKSLL